MSRSFLRLTFLCTLFMFSVSTSSNVEGVHYNIGPENATNFAGYINVNKTRNLFYWFFESRNDPASDPFILWMTGGELEFMSHSSMRPTYHVYFP